MTITKHAEARIRQRGISEEVVKLIWAFGESRPAPHGAEFLQIKSIDADKIIDDCHQIIDLIQVAAKNVRLVVGDDSTVITVERKNKKHKRG